MSSLLIYTEQTSNRLTYIFDLLIGDLLGLDYELTGDKEKFATYTEAKFSYANQPVADEIFFASALLLFEKNIDLQPITFCHHGGLSGFYPVSKQSTIPFDIFASAFFMLTRYEEYLPAKNDKYHRYRGSKSLNYIGEFLDKPMVNYYAIELRKMLRSKFPTLTFKKHKFKHIVTFDIDMAYSYLEKGFIRNLGGFGRSFILSEHKAMRERLLVLVGKKPDPFDTFDYIFNICTTHSLSPIFFFLLADGSELDKNIPHCSNRFRKLIQGISSKNEVGIHLSFNSHTSSETIGEEINRLAEITGSKVVRNRYHYLRFHLPKSYEQLIDQGILEDYSMAYAPRTGFRAGICSPFYFFNLKTNQSTRLRIFPVSVMDATFTQYKKSDAEQAVSEIREIMNVVEEVEGTFISLWHNSSFTEEGVWKGWRKVFETITREAAEIMKRP
ncbi:MAG: polysaccharide deacetylase family protein [Bacteroidota bacterium]